MKTINVKSLGQCPYLISLESNDFIGKGSYASVCRAYNSNNPTQKLAAKIFDLSDAKKYESAMKQLVVVQKIPDHDNLVSYKKIKITSKSKLYIIMEQCRQSLQHKLDKETDNMSELQVWNIICQICEGYKILQQKQIVHRDIKPDNILIGYDGKYKISDFGLSDILTQFIQQHRYQKPKGSLPFIAPQILFSSDNKKCLQSIVDVYSLGVTIYYICFRNYPYLVPHYSHSHQHQHHRKFSMSVCQFLKQIKNHQLNIPQGHTYSQQLLAMIEGCLQKQPNQRFSWQYIYLLLLKRSHQTFKTSKNLQNLNINDKKHNNFRIVQISDAFLKNLSTLDGQLYASLSNQSLVIIDHIEATIISKRQIIFYCDRLYYRLCVIYSKIDLNLGQQQAIRTKNQHKQQKYSLLQQFTRTLMIFNYLKCKQLDKQFEKYYEQIDKHQLLKCIASKKYQGIRSLIKQDLSFLEYTLSEQQSIQFELQKINKKQNSSSTIDEYTIKIYQNCSQIILKLYQLRFYEQCKQVDQLQKYLSCKQNSVLHKLRRNQNALIEFDRKIGGIDSNSLKQLISRQYLHQLKQADSKIVKQ